MDGGHMQQQLPISPDQLDSPPLHPLPPSLIPPHLVSHSSNAAPINSPPRTTTPTAPTTPSCLSILPDSEKCSDSQFVQEEAQVKPIDGSPNTPSKHNMEIKAPMIGMKFDCDDSAYEFYKEYAHRMGFSVRKQYVRRGSAGHVKRRTFCCSKEGERAIDKRREQDLQEMRIKCCLSSMEGEIHGEVAPKNVSQDDGGFESHVDISQGICGIKTKPTVGRPRGRLKSSLERTKKKSQNKKDQSKKTCGARQFQSCGGLNRVDSSVNINSYKEHSNVEQPSQLVDNITQESFSCSNLVGQDNVVGFNGLNQEFFECEFLVGQDHIGLYGLNQASVDPDIDNL
ncbi:uncharacterized protein LOC115985473 [Quercus lobata]|uniref:uncharacterized protein LOC115985473 n=1 Tax=Quercus lobata TaxID=97700 RepID=UPI0012490529|nr:uncharacterized protein LOC115985473 [Quercus lobata]